MVSSLLNSVITHGAPPVLVPKNDARWEIDSVGILQYTRVNLAQRYRSPPFGGNHHCAASHLERASACRTLLDPERSVVVRAPEATTAVVCGLDT